MPISPTEDGSMSWWRFRNIHWHIKHRKSSSKLSKEPERVDFHLLRTHVLHCLALNFVFGLFSLLLLLLRESERSLLCVEAQQSGREAEKCQENINKIFEQPSNNEKILFFVLAGCDLHLLVSCVVAVVSSVVSANNLFMNQCHGEGWSCGRNFSRSRPTRTRYDFSNKKHATAEHSRIRARESTTFDFDISARKSHIQWRGDLEESRCCSGYKIYTTNNNKSDTWHERYNDIITMTIFLWISAVVVWMGWKGWTATERERGCDWGLFRLDVHNEMIWSRESTGGERRGVRMSNDDAVENIILTWLCSLLSCCCSSRARIAYL